MAEPVYAKIEGATFTGADIEKIVRRDAVRDCTGCTEVDPNNRLTLAADGVTAASMPNSEDCYSYFDDGASHYGAYFEIRFDFNVSSAGTNGRGTVCAVSNRIDDAYDWENNNREALEVRAYTPSGSDYIQLHNHENGESDSCGLTIGTRYYCRFIRMGSHAVVLVYTDADYSAFVARLKVSVDSSRTYQYHFITNSRNTGSGGPISYDTKNHNVIGETGTARGLSLKLGGETANTFAFLGNGIYPKCNWQNSPQIGNHWTVKIDDARYCYRSHFIPVSDCFTAFTETTTASESDARQYFPLDKIYTEADSNIKLQFKMQFDDLASGRFFIGFYNSKTAIKHDVIVFHFRSGQWYARMYDTAGNNVVSPLSTAVLSADTDYWCEVEFDQTAMKIYARVYSDTWGGTLVEAEEVDVTGHSFSVDSIGFGSNGTDANYRQNFRMYEFVCAQADFTKYDTSEPVASLPQLSLAGDLDPSTAEFSIIQNGVSLDDDSDRFKLRYSVDGGAYSAWMTVSAYKALASFSIATSLDFDFKFISDGTQQIQMYDPCIGDLTPAGGDGAVLGVFESGAWR